MAETIIELKIKEIKWGSKYEKNTGKIKEVKEIFIFI